MRANAPILKDYSFYTANIQKQDVFVVFGLIKRREEHDIGEKEQISTFRSLLFGRSWHDNVIDVHEEPCSDDDK